MASVESSDPAVDDLRRRARRRLVGAAILALAAAVLLPLLLENEPKPLGDDVSIQIPSQDGGTPSSQPGAQKRLGGRSAPATPSTAPGTEVASTASKDLGASEAPTNPLPPAVAGDSKPTATEPSRTEAVSARSDVPVASSAATPGSSPSPQSLPASTPGAGSAPVGKASEKTSTGASVAVAPAKASVVEGFVVQLAAFADPATAKALVGQLKSSGFSAYVEPLATSRGSVHRVRVGPYASREAAEAAQAKLKRGGHKGMVTRASRS